MYYKPCIHCLGDSRYLPLSLLNLTQPVTQKMACCQSMDNIEPTFFETSASTSDIQGKTNKWRRNCIARKRNWIGVFPIWWTIYSSLGGGYRGDRLESGVWEEGMPSRIQSQLERLHRWSVQNILWQFVPVRDYWSAVRMFKETGFTPLFVNLKVWPLSPKRVGAAKTVSHGR